MTFVRLQTYVRVIRTLIRTSSTESVGAGLLGSAPSSLLTVTAGKLFPIRLRNIKDVGDPEGAW